MVEKAEKERKLKFPFHSVPTRRVIENSKKIAKKFKKLKNTFMASFQANIGWKRLRKRENKKISFRFVLTRTVIENSKKIAKKIQKIKKHLYGLISSQYRLEKTEKERK